MPFNLKNTEAIYQRVMQTVFEDILQKTMQRYVNNVVAK